MTAWVTKNGLWRIEAIQRTNTSKARGQQRDARAFDGSFYRITCCNFHVADARTPTEIGEYVNLSDLEEVN